MQVTFLFLIELSHFLVVDLVLKHSQKDNFIDATELIKYTTGRMIFINTIAF